ncbi:DUF2971 domain-containing protein [Vibrio owensii]|uniref:DUF2971 domain-containing protein n=1 Tax=Vibrio owensii TaxID=696485 RepID=UPI0013780B41|nr:DUF2971 domain-containing protein [Vibrio owensii]
MKKQTFVEISGRVMILYKYRALNSIEFTLDILLNERLYCASYKELNDPFEGQLFDAHPKIVPIFDKSNNEFLAFKQLPEGQTKRQKLSSIDDLGHISKGYKICSLSKSPSDVKMWSLYADSHRGIAIELEIEDSIVSEVKYVDSLPIAMNTLLTRESAEQIFSRKTKDWDYEREYRIITTEQYFPVKSKIRRILLGVRVSEIHVEILRKLLPSTIPIVQTKLDPSNASVIT